MTALGRYGPDEIGRVHLTVWRQAYRGIIADAFIDGLTEEGAVALWRDILARPETRPARRLVAIAPDKSVAGMVAWGLSRDADPVVPDELFAIDVLEEHHGTGLADLMLLESIGETSTQMLWVLDKNALARSFYRRHGFVEQDTRRYHDEFQADELLMIRGGMGISQRRPS